MARRFGEVCFDRKHNATYWYINVNLDGKRHRLRGYRTLKGRLLRFPDETAARQALEEIRSDIRHGIEPAEAITEFLPFGTPQTLFEKHYIDFCKARARDRSVSLSRQRVTELWGHLGRGHLDQIKGVPVQMLGYAELEDWVAHLFDTTKLSKNSIHHIVADVRTFLRWLARRGEIRSAPEIPTVRVPEYVPDVPTAAVQERVLGTIPWRSRGVFMARGFMGLRPSEARNADLADYWFDPGDEQRDVLTVRKSKSNRFRLIPAPAPVVAWVREFHSVSNLRDADSPAVPLFDNPNGMDAGRWSGSSERRVLLAAMKACGVKHRPNELLRHAFGTDAANRLLAEGNSPADVSRLIMAIMGHTEVKTSARYVRLATEGLERIVSREWPANGPLEKRPL
jgi:integrase